MKNYVKCTVCGHKNEVKGVQTLAPTSKSSPSTPFRINKCKHYNHTKIHGTDWCYDCFSQPQSPLEDKHRIVYACKRCQYELSWGAILCPGCGNTDPSLKIVGAI